MDIDSLLQSYQGQELDTNKVKTLNHIVNYYMYRDEEKAMHYAFKELEHSEGLDFKPGIALANYQIGIVFNNIDELDSSRYYYSKSLELVKQINNAKYISQAYRGLAILEFSQGNLNETDSINNLDLAHTIKTKDSIGIALAYDFNGTINQNKGHYEIALTNVLKGLELFKLLKHEIRIADCLNHLATIEKNLGHRKKQLHTTLKSWPSTRILMISIIQAQVLNDIGVMYMNLNQHEKARDYYEQSIQKSREVNVKTIETSTLTNIWSSYINEDEADKAIDFLKRSINLAESINAKRKVAIARNKLAETYNLINQPDLALKELEKSMDYAQQSDAISLLRTAYKHRSQSYEKLNNSRLALLEFKEFKRLNDIITNAEKLKRVEELKIVYETKKKEAALALQEEETKKLNVQVENDKLTKTLYSDGAIAGLSLSALLFFGFRQRIKKNKITREKQEEIYKQEIAFKKKELAIQTLHPVQKNTFLQKLKNNLEKLKNSPEKFKLEFRRIVVLLKKESATDEDWKVFKSYFTEVHDNFYTELKAINDDISEKDLRLASFLKMNLSTKEIAAILNVLPQSVLTSKYRLKKKLGLEKEMDIYDFLIKVS